MARYTIISIEEMREVLQTEKGWTEVELEGVEEHVFDWKVPHFCAVIRVYTSIAKGNDCGRSCGRDAIRVCAVATDVDRGLVNSKPRVHRVEGWRNNLQRRIMNVLELTKKRATPEPPEIPTDEPTIPETFPTKTGRLQFFKGAVVESRDLAVKILLTTYEAQTSDEQAVSRTIDHNGIGFGSFDAGFASSLVEQWTEKGWFSTNQWPYVHQLARKYIGQYITRLEDQGTALIVKGATV